MKPRIGVVQFSPKVRSSADPSSKLVQRPMRVSHVNQLGHVQANIARAKEITDRIQPGSLDLLCFPEMAFTGYNFQNASAVAPFLEKPRVGPTSVFCSDLAKRLGCFVTAGYPELLEPAELNECIEKDQITFEDGDSMDEERHVEPVRQIVGANSASLFDPSGEWVGGYRKTNLFKTDKTWAAAGDGFTTFHLPPPLNNVTLAICMDLNPFPRTSWDFETGPYELADYCQAQGTNVLVLLNAWLDPDRESDDEPSWSTLNYWALRLRPLWLGKSESEPLPDGPTREEITTVVICNRSGEENGVIFAGTSALFRMSQSHGKAKLIDMMTKEEEGIRIWNT